MIVRNSQFGIRNPVALGPFSRALGDGPPAVVPAANLVSWAEGVANWLHQGNNKWFVIGAVAFALVVAAKGRR